MRPCKKCNREPEYDERYDALFCEKCRIWLEEACPEPDCGYCARRPAIPPGLPRFVPKPAPKALGTLRDARWVPARQLTKPSGSANRPRAAARGAGR